MHRIRRTYNFTNSNTRLFFYSNFALKAVLQRGCGLKTRRGLRLRARMKIPWLSVLMETVQALACDAFLAAES